MLFCLLMGGGRGVHHPVLGGECTLGYPHPDMVPWGIHLSWPRMGVPPLSGPGMGYHPPIQTWDGAAQSLEWGTPCPDLVGGGGGVASVNRLKILPSLILRMRAVINSRCPGPFTKRNLKYSKGPLFLCLVLIRIRTIDHRPRNSQAIKPKERKIHLGRRYPQTKNEVQVIRRIKGISMIKVRSVTSPDQCPWYDPWMWSYSKEQKLQCHLDMEIFLLQGK